jgi:hypothetical protein
VHGAFYQLVQLLTPATRLAKASSLIKAASRVLLIENLIARQAAWRQGSWSAMQLCSIGSAAPGGCVSTDFPGRTSFKSFQSFKSRLEPYSRCNSTLIMSSAIAGEQLVRAWCAAKPKFVWSRRRHGGYLLDMAACAATNAAEPQEPSQPARYTGSDGRPKATFEEAFRLGRIDGNMRQMPWQLSWQRNERTLKLTDDTQAHLVKVVAV